MHNCANWYATLCRTLEAELSSQTQQVQTHIDSIEKLHADYQNKLTNMIDSDSHQQQLASVQTQFGTKIEQLHSEYKQQIEAIQQQHIQYATFIYSLKLINIYCKTITTHCTLYLIYLFPVWLF
jgi:GTP1/Obg family GTP-binding protein